MEIVDSIEELVKRVDVRLSRNATTAASHLEQVQPVLAAKKPVFIDKPIAGSLADTIRILDAAEEVRRAGSSARRRCASARRRRRCATARIGKVQGAETISPAHPGDDPSRSLLVRRARLRVALHRHGHRLRVREARHDADGKIEVIGTWDGGRTGIFRGTAGPKGYGGKAVGEKGEAAIGSYDGYDVLLVEIVKMFRTGVVPVSREETLELYAFMEAADESKRRGGAEVTLKEVLDKARAEVAAKP